MFTTLKKHTASLLLLTIILAGFLQRSLSFQSAPFAFDQVQIAQAADAITSGDFTLIGPRTGPAPIFTGPLIYYLAAIFTLILPSWWAVFFTSVFICLVTGIVLLFLSRRYLNQKFTFILLLLWAFSPFLIKIDRTPWNPNLSFLAASLVFFPLLSKTKSLKLKDLILIALGVFLGYQAHFSGLLLAPIAGLSLLLFFHRQLFGLVFIIFSFIASLLPTLLFDYKHDWLNLRGLWYLLSNKESVSLFQLFSRLIDRFRILLETLGKLLFEGTNYQLVITTGIFILSLYILSKLRSRQFSLLLKTLLWLVVIPLSFSFYRQSTPEYYYLICLPPLFYLIADTVEGLFKPQTQTILCVFLLLYSLLYSSPSLLSPSGFSLSTQLKAVSMLVEASSQDKLSQLIVDVDPVDALGFNYLLGANPLQFSSHGQTYHLVYPSANNRFRTYPISSQAHFWVDPRNPNQNHLTTTDFILSVSPDWHLYQSYALVAGIDYQFHYLIQNQNGERLGDIYVFNKKFSDNLLTQVKKLLNQPDTASQWLTGQSLPQAPEQMYYLGQDLLFVSTLIAPDQITVHLPL